MDVPIFNVPDGLLNQGFVVQAEEGNRFRLIQEKHNIELQGTVGSTLEADTALGHIQLRIDQLAANPGAEFALTRMSRLTTIENIQRAMSVSEQGKQSGVIEVTLQGQNPKQVNATLNEIGREYIRQNQARKTEEAQKSLAFLEKQLPELKQQLEQAEAKYNQFRNTHGTIDLSEEAKQSLLQSSVAKTKRIELQQKKTELLANFTENHPAVKGINSQLKEINNEINSIGEHIKTMPLLEQEVLRMTRDIKVNTDLYTALLNTAQQLRLITAGKVSNVRLVDASMTPEKPLKPNRPVVLGVAALIGLFLGVVMAFIRRSLKMGIDDPQRIEQVLGIPVYATIPHSKRQKQLYEQVPKKSRSIPLLAKVAPNDIAIESLRNFRTALQYSMLHSKNNIVLMTGATPGLGKSFVSVNFAAVMAASGKKVLLIDADLRDGHLHQYFGLGRENGLSDSITGAMRVEQAICRGVYENMDFLSTGSLPPNPSELLLRPNLGPLLTSLAAGYDLVLIDTSPILAAADALIIGSHAGAIYIMARAEVTTQGEIKESIKRLAQAGLSAKGILLNDQKLRSGGYEYAYEYGQYSGTQYGPRTAPMLEAPMS
jgi:tyrosine-protein kinase Etk/Wzc